MKKLLLSLIALVSLQAVRADLRPDAKIPVPEYTLTKASLEIPVPTKSTIDTNFTRLISLKFVTPTKPEADAKITLLLIGDAGEIKPGFIINGTSTDVTIDIDIAAGDVKKDPNGVGYIFRKDINLKYFAPIALLKNNPSVSIAIKDKLKDLITLTFVNASTSAKNATYWMEMGSNFDLLDGLSANNLYANITAFDKDIAKTNFFGIIKRDLDVSFTGGVYESKSTSIATSSAPGVDTGKRYIDERSFSKIAGKGYPYFQDIGPYNITTTVQSIGLFFSPHFKLSTLSSNTEGFHIYLSIYAEMLWQRVKASYDYSASKTDTLYNDEFETIKNKYAYRTTTTNMDYRSHYFGLGLPMYLSHDDYTIYINPVVGATSQRFAVFDNLGAYPNGQTNVTNSDPANVGFFTPKHTWNAFYIAQFRLTAQNAGIVFTGEVRGLFLAQSKPIVSLALSKKFDLDKIFTTIFSSPH